MMNIRQKLAGNIRQKLAGLMMKSAGVLSKVDFEDWDAYIQAYGTKKNTGEILWDNYSTLRKQYNGTAYACIRKIAPKIAAVPLHLYIPEGGGNEGARRRIAPVGDETKAFLATLPFIKAMDIREDVEEVTAHSILDLLNGANNRMTRYQIFDRTVTELELTGECYWRLIYDEKDAAPRAIRFMYPEQLTPKENKRGEPDGYTYKKKDDKDETIPEKEMIYFWYAGPHSHNRGFGPVAAMSQRISGEKNIATIQNSILENMGIPPAVIKVMRLAGGEDRFQEFKKAFQDLYGGMTKRGKIAFTQGEWEIEEMGYIEGAKMWREFIANGFGVPASKLTMESSNRAVADVGDTELMRDTILPKLTMIAEELTESLVPRFDGLDGAFFMFDNPVPEDTRTKMLMRRINRTTGVTTPDEERQEDGREPHGSPEASSLAPVRAAMPEQEPEKQAADAIEKALDRVRVEI
jgi:HK97 family phage portal protein